MDDRDRNRDDQTDLEDPLGLKGASIKPRASDRIRASSDEESVRRRRKRAGLGPDGDDRTTSGADELIGKDHHGATGMDMGAGGQGSQIKDETSD